TDDDKKIRYASLKREITPAEQLIVRDLGLPGIGVEYLPKRFYPAGPETAHVVGLTDSDGNGLSGIERGLNARLAAGEDVRLSIDLRVQHAVRAALQQGIADFTAIGGAAIVMDV